MARRSKTSPTQLEAEERQIRALRLRLAGVPLQQIADELDYASASGAYEAIMAALDKARAEPAAELREIMAMRLDEMLTVAYENALQGDTDSMMAVLRIEERRARLFGIDRREAPVKTTLPKLSRPEDAMTVVGELLQKATNGELSPDEAGKLSALVQAFMKIAETTQLAERIAKLEEMQDEPGKTAGEVGGERQEYAG